jgi:hypothetical protein
VLIYGLPTEIKSHGLLDPIWGQGNRIYRVHYDGQQMNLVEDVSETTGMGLGVHCVIYPDGNGFAAADGQEGQFARSLTGRRFHSCRKTINRLPSTTAARRHRS